MDEDGPAYQQGINGKATLSKVGNPHVLHDQGQGSMKLL